jgi:YVTN family beta-propeller protein
MSRWGSRSGTVGTGVVIVVACLVLTSLYVPAYRAAAPGNVSDLAARVDPTARIVSRDSTDVSSPGAGANVAISAASAGRVARTIFLNYNANISGNFPSAVWNWQVGEPAVDPATGDLWIPTLAITRIGVSTPTSGPTIVYDPTTNSSHLVWNLQNSSAFVFDPVTGLLFSAEPNNNSVAVFNPATESWVRGAIPVGSDPSSVVYDPLNETVFVANQGSDNLTVVNASTLAVAQPGVAVSGSPKLLLADSRAVHRTRRYRKPRGDRHAELRRYLRESDSDRRPRHGHGIRERD